MVQVCSQRYSIVDQAVPTGFDVPPEFPYKRFALVIKYDKRLFKDEKELKGENTTLGILYKCLRTSRRENTSIGQPANEMVVSE